LWILRGIKPVVGGNIHVHVIVKDGITKILKYSHTMGPLLTKSTWREKCIKENIERRVVPCGMKLEKDKVFPRFFFFLLLLLLLAGIGWEKFGILNMMVFRLVARIEAEREREK